MSTVASTLLGRFEEEAPVYDKLIHRLVPLYAEQSRMVGWLARYLKPSAARALDLGAGTGELSEVLLEALPTCHVTVNDFSEKMLRQARRRLDRWGDRVVMHLSDFSIGEIGGNFDLIVSGFAIHHLDTPSKERVYGKICDALAPAGLFIHREMVSGPTAVVTEAFEHLWAGHLRCNGEDPAVWIDGHRDEDRPDSLPAQLEMMSRVGFENVASFFQCGPFSVFGGTKPQAIAE